MPETVTTTVTAQDLKAGDVLTYKGETRTIAGVQVGTKLAHITFEGDTKPRWHDPLGIGYEVQRQRPTAEEKAAKELRYRLEGLDWLERMDRDRFATLCAKVAEQAGRGQVPSWDLLDELPQAEAAVQLWNKVARVHANRAQASLSGLAEEPTRLGTIADVAEGTIDDLLMGTRTGGSTSQASNLIEDGRRAGQAAWCRNWREAQTR